MKIEIPAESVLYLEQGGYKYRDSFSVLLCCQDVAATELIAAFFHSPPAWFDFLAALRDRIVSLFGLKSRSSNPRMIDLPYRVGQRIGYFRILHLTVNEVVLGEDDQHLDFRTSLLVANQTTGARLTVSTLVKTKNRLGITYFSIVKHFHRHIVPIMVKRMARIIEEKTLPCRDGMTHK